MKMNFAKDGIFLEDHTELIQIDQIFLVMYYFLNRLRWDIIKDEWFRGDQEFGSDEKKRLKHAEVLVPDSLPLNLIQAISVNSEEMAKAVNQLIAIASNRTNLSIPFSTYKPSLFFQ